jgi:hypothetical protein
MLRKERGGDGKIRGGEVGVEVRGKEARKETRKRRSRQR